MKKCLLIISFIYCGCLNVNAQITITTADVAAPSKVMYQSIDTMPTVSAGFAGASQTWNMLVLNSHLADTVNIIPLGWVPDTTSFPSSNMVIKNNGAPFYGYGSNTSTSLTMLGNVGTIDPGTGPTQIIQRNTPSEKMLNFPSNYGSDFTNNFVSEFTFYYGIDPGVGFVIDSVRQKSTISKNVTCDAWGNIATPLGTYAALRFYEIRHQTDSTFGYVTGFGWGFFEEVVDSSKSLSWWANGVGFPLVDADIDWTTGSIIRAKWLQTLPVAGIDEYVSSFDVNVFPNPAQNELNLEMDPAMVSFVRIFDIAGKMVAEISPDAERSLISTARFANGIYSFSVIGKENRLLKQGRFAVVK